VCEGLCQVQLTLGGEEVDITRSAANLADEIENLLESMAAEVLDFEHAFRNIKYHAAKLRGIFSHNVLRASTPEQISGVFGRAVIKNGTDLRAMSRPNLPSRKRGLPRQRTRREGL
jgi:hypothetical protein